ncbi:MAG TPA: ABC transporter substrate-binding protein, partial [Gammaproteobacteria bacterium]|nr:ABC transporter substrate-binding protein [Gammaproteobacteria bacterium]
MTVLRIGGVPEHFNLPWHRALEAAASGGVQAQWQDFPDGSGAMAEALSEQRLDAAMLLTEGAVAGIARGGNFKIVSLYTESPLLWGIHVPASSRFRAVADIAGARYAISRRGSGSHLMAFVHARERGWPLDLELVLVRNLEGAVEAFATGTADVFFWEKFMTKPLVDDGRFRRVGDFTAPWHAFVVCASDAALAR